jgi:hypothetical protein
MSRKRPKPKMDRKMPMVHPNAAAIDVVGVERLRGSGTGAGPATDCARSSFSLLARDWSKVDPGGWLTDDAPRCPIPLARPQGQIKCANDQCGPRRKTVARLSGVRPGSLGHTSLCGSAVRNQRYAIASTGDCRTLRRNRWRGSRLMSSLTEMPARRRASMPTKPTPSAYSLVIRFDPGPGTMTER